MFWVAVLAADLCKENENEVKWRRAPENDVVDSFVVAVRESVKLSLCDDESWLDTLD